MCTKTRTLSFYFPSTRSTTAFFATGTALETPDRFLRAAAPLDHFKKTCGSLATIDMFVFHHFNSFVTARACVLVAGAASHSGLQKRGGNLSLWCGRGQAGRTRVAQLPHLEHHPHKHKTRFGTPFPQKHQHKLCFRNKPPLTQHQ